MKLAAFNATCPFEIGDKITERREIHTTGLAFNGPVFTEVTHTITTLCASTALKPGKSSFCMNWTTAGSW